MLTIVDLILRHALDGGFISPFVLQLIAELVLDLLFVLLLRLRQLVSTFFLFFLSNLSFFTPFGKLLLLSLFLISIRGILLFLDWLKLFGFLLLELLLGKLGLVLLDSLDFSVRFLFFRGVLLV